jgi:hypothetical protein
VIDQFQLGFHVSSSSKKIGRYLVSLTPEIAYSDISDSNQNRMTQLQEVQLQLQVQAHAPFTAKLVRSSSSSICNKLASSN